MKEYGGKCFQKTYVFQLNKIMLHANKKIICSSGNIIDPLDVCFCGNFLLKNTNINVKNIKYNSYPFIAHNPEHGNKKHILWERLLLHHSLFSCRIPNDLTVVTWNNKSFSLLEEQLKKLNIEYICLGKDEFFWNSNRIKISTLVKASIKTKYCLGMDAYDVVILQDLNNIVDKFKETNCELIYNATSKVHPFCNEHYEIESKMADGVFRFLNSGVFIGNTKFLMNCLNELNISDPQFSYSDQFIIRKLYHKYYPKIKVDWNCSLFQIFFLENDKIENYVELEPAYKLYA